MGIFIILLFVRHVIAVQNICKPGSNLIFSLCRRSIRVLLSFNRSCEMCSVFVSGPHLCRLKINHLLCYPLQTTITWDGDKLVCVQRGEIEGRGWTHWIEGDELHLVGQFSCISFVMSLMLFPTCCDGIAYN